MCPSASNSSVQRAKSPVLQPSRLHLALTRPSHSLLPQLPIIPQIAVLGTPTLIIHTRMHYLPQAPLPPSQSWKSRSRLPPSDRRAPSRRRRLLYYPAAAR